MSKNVVMVGAGVANVNAATKLIDNGFDGKITIIDMGKNPYDRKYSEVMEGFLGAGGWSDGKLTYHTSIGGQLSKYRNTRAGSNDPVNDSIYEKIEDLITQL